jgi:hypothetical protein
MRPSGADRRLWRVWLHGYTASVKHAYSPDIQLASRFRRCPAAGRLEGFAEFAAESLWPVFASESGGDKRVAPVCGGEVEAPAKAAETAVGEQDDGCLDALAGGYPGAVSRLVR